MTRFKSIVCVLLIFLMAMGAALPAFAAGSDEVVLADGETYASVLGKVSPYDTDRKQSPLYLKNVLFFGDSLCRAKADGSGYAGRLGARYAMNWANYSESGYLVSNKGMSIYSRLRDAYYNNQAKDTPETYDLIVLEGGVNDAWQNVPLGEVGDSFSEKDFDRSTFAGGLEAVICYAKKNFPEATICYIIMYQMPKAQWQQNGSTYEPVEGVRDRSEYVAIQKQIFEKWEIPYLNFYEDQVFNSDILKTDTTDYLVEDYIHLNSAGYTLLTPYIATWLETLPLPQRQESETTAAPVTTEVPEAMTNDGSSDGTDKSSAGNDSGCVSAAGGMGVIALAAVSVGVTVKKKKKEK